MTGAHGANPFLAGARGRCPNCGRGPLFAGFLKLAPRCAVCGHELGAVDSGDGPAVFVIIAAGFLAVFGALITEIAYRPPVWVSLTVWPVVAVVLCLVLLRPIKGLMVAAQVRNRAAQHDSGPMP